MKQFTQQQLKFINENFQQGQRALQTGMFARAEKCFQDILKISPEIIEAQNALAFVYAASKHHSKASNQFKVILKLRPNDAHVHHNLANSLYEQKLYTEALQHYLTALKINPALVDSHIHCAFAHRMLKDYDSAIACLKRALDLDKKNAKAFHALGMAYAEIEDYPRALECLENSVGLAPKHAAFRVDFAWALEKASLDYEAGIQYHLACETDPNHLDSFMLYGDHLNKCHRHDEALECFKRAEHLSPRNLDIFDRFGLAYLGMGNTDAAIEKFNLALKQDQNRLSSLDGIGQVYQELGNIDDAIKIADKIISIDPDLPNGYLLKSRIKKSSKDDGLAEQLQEVLANTDMGESAKTLIYFALGKVYDDQKNYQQAFKYYAEGNKLRNESFEYDSAIDEDRFDKIIETFSTDFLSQHRNLGAVSDLPVIIAGMPRSGTTLTEQIISSHPSVLGAGEVSFWGRAKTAMPLRMSSAKPFPECVQDLSPEAAKDIAAMYESTLRKVVGPASHGIKHITDKMPHNFLNLGLIALLFPNVKIIHTRRDPIDTCLSIYFQNFNDAHPYSFDLTNLGRHYKQYERIMQHWHNILPGRIMDINYEDTIADPEYWSRKLISHIGLEWDDACLSPHKLERTVKTASHWQVRQPIYKTSVQRWKNYEAYIQPLIEALK